MIRTTLARLRAICRRTDAILRGEPRNKHWLTSRDDERLEYLGQR